MKKNTDLWLAILQKFGNQENFAAAVEEHASYVSLVVNGRRPISTERKQKWADALGAPVPKVFPGA